MIRGMNYGMICGVSVGYLGIFAVHTIEARCWLERRSARVLQGPQYQDTKIAKIPARNESHIIRKC